VDTGSQGLLVTRSPDHLRLHPALVRLNLMSSVVELNDVCRQKNHALREPILITANGTIISGFKDWHLAVTDARPSVDCIEYSLSDEEAIQFILRRQQPGRKWNQFNRIRLALELEPHFRAKALANQIAGGSNKGSANLPQPDRIDVRREIADAAGVGARNVSNVKVILQQADPRLTDALQIGTVSINRALTWCSLPRARQVEELTSFTAERSTGKVTRRAIAQLRTKRPSPDLAAVVKAMEGQESKAPGSIVMRASQRQRTTILIGQDLLRHLHSQPELELG